MSFFVQASINMLFPIDKLTSKGFFNTLILPLTKGQRDAQRSDKFQQKWSLGICDVVSSITLEKTSEKVRCGFCWLFFKGHWCMWLTEQSMLTSFAVWKMSWLLVCGPAWCFKWYHDIFPTQSHHCLWCVIGEQDTKLAVKVGAVLKTQEQSLL